MPQGLDGSVTPVLSERTNLFLWDYLRQAYPKDAGLRQDHFLLNKNVAGRLTAEEVDMNVLGWDGSSDQYAGMFELADYNVPATKKKRCTMKQ
jgi:hypothetical protein